MRTLTRYGTYGFLSALIAAQLSLSPRLVADDGVERSKVDAKKSARSLKRDVKKLGRKATGQESTYDDVKDEVKDGVSNVEDEASYQKKKIENKTK